MINKLEKWQYMLVSPVSIIRSRKGPVGLGNADVVGLNRSRSTRLLGNQRIIEQYLTEVGLDGWQLVTSLMYEGLPNRGSLIFRKKYFVEEEKTPEISTVTVDYKENLNKGNLYQEMELETGKNAVWQGKETKNFRDWLEAKNSEKTEAPKEA